MASNCYCQSSKPFSDCCQPLLAGQPAPSAEALMRSRYSAHVLGNIDYLLRSWDNTQASAGDIKDWVEGHDWLGLQILQCRQGGPSHKTGTVEFIAYYRPKGSQERLAHHELSNFIRADGHWYYVDGATPKGAPKKTGRNDPCPCGSGKKFKQCCI